MDLLCICLLLLHDLALQLLHPALRLKRAADKHNASAFHFIQNAAPKTSISVSHVRFESEGTWYLRCAVRHVFFFYICLDTEHAVVKGEGLSQIPTFITESLSYKLQVWKTECERHPYLPDREGLRKDVSDLCGKKKLFNAFCSSRRNGLQ